MRYLPLTSGDRAAMLAKIGVRDVDALFRDVPKSAVVPLSAFDLPDTQGELEVERTLSRLAAKNAAADAGPFFCGAGAYKHHVPAAVDHLIQRSEFLTSYTPYQPEIAQGTLQYLFEFQTQVALLTGMEVANASLYDGSTATAEAVLMAQRLTKRPKAILSGGLHPHYVETVETVANLHGHVLRAPATPGRAEDIAALIDGETACVVVQSPDVFGLIRDLKPVAEAAHAKGALLIAVVTEVVSLGLIEPPGHQGADIVAAEGQSIGNGLGFGGPYVGLFATCEKFVRQMPGRLSGETVDAQGRRGYTLTLSTREQHIRREKATSNICTNSGLCALAFTIHLSLLGEEGFVRLARANHARASTLADRLAQVKGVSLVTPSFFNEFALQLPNPAAEVVEALAAKGVIAGVPASRLLPHDEAVRNLLIVAATETSTDEDCAVFAKTLAEVL
ncbi:MAG: aminomethyl-transferring glycine dehydrogenase subunit GcvPA [Alphaproteobacteria bacterium]|nr:aminomethyl-transferring glycine dehydrogenase subunit GcvPA [Alphaproteobacteria bacterium]MDE2112612.1 aminomethyl-transferring glycine dehydrogenase subunit GcvPA [Alphaproteobacteria bacterium]MDE2494449.1 aminomethyl-transferring glycine dehydrogenase subunit GcvPA [Alphaproteobacteria bacterium]